MTLVCLHGFLGSKDDLLPLKNSLSKAHEVHTLDLPGHGSRPLDLQPFYHEITEIDPSFIYGYSLGGRLALEYTIQNQDKLKGLILESASAGIRGCFSRWKRRKSDAQWARKLREQEPHSFLREWYSQPVFSDLSEQAQISLQRDRPIKDPRRLAAALTRYGQGSMASSWLDLRKLTLPVLLLHGSRDLRYSQLMHKMEKALPDARRVEIDGGGHNLHRYHLEKVAEAVRQFIPGSI